LLEGNVGWGFVRFVRIGLLAYLSWFFLTPALSKGEGDETVKFCETFDFLIEFYSILVVFGGGKTRVGIWLGQ
jgi:hypothetical protein